MLGSASPVTMPERDIAQDCSPPDRDHLVEGICRRGSATQHRLRSPVTTAASPTGPAIDLAAMPGSTKVGADHDGAADRRLSLRRRARRDRPARVDLTRVPARRGSRSSVRNSGAVITAWRGGPGRQLTRIEPAELFTGHSRRDSGFEHLLSLAQTA